VAEVTVDAAATTDDEHPFVERSATTTTTTETSISIAVVNEGEQQPRRRQQERPRRGGNCVVSSSLLPLSTMAVVAVVVFVSRIITALSCGTLSPHFFFFFATSKVTDRLQAELGGRMPASLLARGQPCYCSLSTWLLAPADRSLARYDGLSFIIVMIFFVDFFFGPTDGQGHRHERRGRTDRRTDGKEGGGQRPDHRDDGCLLQ